MMIQVCGLTQPAGSFFITRGNNISSAGCGGILFAPQLNASFQAFGTGCALLSKPIDLRYPYSTSFILDFVDTTGVDGGTFILQRDAGETGSAYDGLGFRGISHSVAITFDAVRNSRDHDPDFDHLSIQANGDVDHLSANNLAGPLSLEPFYDIAYYPPGPPPVRTFHHLVTIRWAPASFTLAVEIDHVEVLSVQSDIVGRFFGGNSRVYAGFTASNTQPAALPPSIEYQWGHMYFILGEVFPRFTTLPTLDTCLAGPVFFRDESIYATDNNQLDLGLFKWYWEFGDGQSSGQQNPVHQYQRAGDYLLKFTVTNQAGCTFDTLTRMVHLGSPPIPNFSLSSYCDQTPVILQDQTQVEVGTPTSWIWRIDGGPPITGREPELSFDSPGRKAISLRVGTEYGCIADTIKWEEISEKPQLTADFNKNCEGLVSFQAVMTNGVPVNQWAWAFDDGQIGQIQNPTHFYPHDGAYEPVVVTTSTAGCPSDSIRLQVPIKKVFAFAGNDTIVAIGQPTQLHGEGGMHFQWRPGTGLDNPFAPDPIAILNRDQQYELVVTNDDGCEARDTMQVKVYDGPALYVPSAFSPNGDGKNDLFRVIAPGFKSLRYLGIYNRFGQKVFESHDFQTPWDGKVGGLPQPPGVYVFIIEAVDYQGIIVQKRGTLALIR